jgi:hypothetical protein
VIVPQSSQVTWNIWRDCPLLLPLLRELEPELRELRS